MLQVGLAARIGALEFLVVGILDDDDELLGDAVERGAGRVVGAVGELAEFDGEGYGVLGSSCSWRWR
jgi:hypothetical protein